MVGLDSFEEAHAMGRGGVIRAFPLPHGTRNIRVDRMRTPPFGLFGRIVGAVRGLALVLCRFGHDEVSTTVCTSHAAIVLY